MNRAEEKRAIRREAALKRDGLPQEKRMAWSDAVCQHTVDRLIAMQQQGVTVHNVMTYVPFRSELDTTLLIEWCWRTGLEVVVPRCDEQDRSMTLFNIHAWDQLSPGAYGIREPDEALARQCHHSFIPDVVFVPGLAFDKRGGRLGYGGGYYDRFYDRLVSLVRNAGTGMPSWIGLGYESQWLSTVPMHVHDVYVDGVITELGYTGGTEHGLESF